MFQLSQPLPNVMTPSDDLIGIGMTPVDGDFPRRVTGEFMSPLVDVVLERKGEFAFETLNDEVRLYGPEKGSTLRAVYHPLMERTVIRVRTGVAEEIPAESLLNEPQRGRSGHADADGEGYPVKVAFASEQIRGDVPLTVEKTREVSVVQHSASKVVDGMMANSENTRCPARKGAEGQPRTKQEGEGLPGVRNEHVPSAKAKMCSELTGNRKTDTETISEVAHD